MCNPPTYISPHSSFYLAFLFLTFCTPFFPTNAILLTHISLHSSFTSCLYLAHLFLGSPPATAISSDILLGRSFYHHTSSPWRSCLIVLSLSVYELPVSRENNIQLHKQFSLPFQLCHVYACLNLNVSPAQGRVLSWLLFFILVFNSFLPFLVCNPLSCLFFSCFFLVCNLQHLPKESQSPCQGVQAPATTSSSFLPFFLLLFPCV